MAILKERISRVREALLLDYRFPLKGPKALRKPLGKLGHLPEGGISGERFSDREFKEERAVTGVKPRSPGNVG